MVESNLSHRPAERTQLAQTKESKIKAIEDALDQLLRMMPANQAELVLLLNAFKTSLRAPVVPSYGYPSMSHSVGRVCVAQFSQQRGTGHRWTDSTSKVAAPLEDAAAQQALYDAISQADRNEVDALLAAHPALVNHVHDRFGTPAMHALYQLKSLRDAHQETTAMQSVLTRILVQPGIQLDKRDSRGNTLAHKAAWWGLRGPLEAIMLEAIMDRALDLGESPLWLLERRNTTSIGGTQVGETVLDNIRMTNQLQLQDKRSILTKAYGAVQPEPVSGVFSWSLSPNTHFMPDGLTPLMVLMKHLHEADPADKGLWRDRVDAYLQKNKHDIRLHEASFNGNTALHFALWNQEYELAQAILSIAEQQQGRALKDVLAARNNVGMGAHCVGSSTVASGGEVPHMNLIAQLKRINMNACFSALNGLFQDIIQSGMVMTNDSGQVIPLSSFFDPTSPLESTLLALRRLQSLRPSENFDSFITPLKQLMGFIKTYQSIYSNGDTPTKTEMGHLLTVYQKEIEGYCAFHFLQQSPTVTVQSLVQRLQSVVLPAELSRLPEDLTQLVREGDEGLYRSISNQVAAWLATHPVDPTTINVELNTLRQVLGALNIHLAQWTFFKAKDTPMPTSDLKQIGEQMKLVQMQEITTSLNEKIQPLQEESHRLQLKIQAMNDSRFGLFYIQESKDDVVIYRHLSDFLTHYQQICAEYGETKDDVALRQDLHTLLESPDHAIFKNHSGLWGKFLDLLDWIARTLLGSNLFQTHMALEFETLREETAHIVSPG